MILNYTKQQVALFVGGSQSIFPNYMMLGSGSGTTTASMNALIAPTDRQAVTSTSNTLYKVSWQGDWNSTEISGLSLTEFGMCASGTGVTGSMWDRTSIPAIQFDGTNELRIVNNYEVF
jgi:hypothetical protein